MKTLISIVIAGALIAPTMASAQRHTTPRTAERHEVAQKQSHDMMLAKKAAKAGQQAENDTTRSGFVPAAKAGKRNLAAPSAGSPN